MMMVVELLFRELNILVVCSPLVIAVLSGVIPGGRRPVARTATPADKGDALWKNRQRRRPAMTKCSPEGPGAQSQSMYVFD
jgi:hypothetical protein